MTRNWLEWIVLAVSALFIAAIAGFLVVDGLTGEGAPPSPIVTLDRDAAYEVDGAWFVPGTVRNGGDVAAEAVLLRATATVDGEEEESELTVDYLPAGTDVDITFVFSGEPEGQLSAQPIAFRLP